ncbi:hypothetical protein KIN20_026787 [Parelaphostrongylus tenuis]|uniref:Uncharacterized protein n=1 Tax=Parelaphostrongylus tenuis TaxID=148309 RepID=A0AAD5WD35_PARTN|nr:hypothetical protein KIN20_026787 [Parelaphostrongylus tenuis]
MFTGVAAASRVTHRNSAIVQSPQSTKARVLLGAIKTPTTPGAGIGRSMPLESCFTTCPHLQGKGIVTEITRDGSTSLMRR